jgi:hypothetical protein
MTSAQSAQANPTAHRRDHAERVEGVTRTGPAMRSFPPDRHLPTSGIHGSVVSFRLGSVTDAEVAVRGLPAPPKGEVSGVRDE